MWNRRRIWHHALPGYLYDFEVSVTVSNRNLSCNVVRYLTRFVAPTAYLETQVKLLKGEESLRKGTYREGKRCTAGIQDQ